METLKDYNKIPIKEGKLVAFNYSGDVRIGKVSGFTKPTRLRDPGIKVRHLRVVGTFASFKGTQESVIKNAGSLCVIEPDDLLVHLL